MRLLFVILAFLLTACVAPIETGQPKGQQLPTAGEHIPPPVFSDGPEKTERFCGVRSASASSCDEPQEYCHREVGDICGAADAPGICRIRPEICTQDYSPVCGCDGKTYSNECTANANGVSMMSKGECK